MLPEMGARLGFKTFRDGDFRPSTDTPDGIYAAEPLMEAGAWEKIIAWYEANAPEKLVLPAVSSASRLELFGIDLPAQEDHEFPVATAILIDEAAHRLVVSDSHDLDVEIYDADLALLGEVRPGGVISRIVRLPSGGYVATLIGDTIGQTEALHGRLIEVVEEQSAWGPFTVNRVTRQLHRPVDVDFGDFNGDGQTDYVIAEFGVHTGQLSLHLSQPDRTFVETILLDEAGAISVELVGDDLLVLMAQGDERVVRLRNFASEDVEAEVVLRFPPAWGSSHMSVLDFNGDGITDLLYIAGDNADISQIFKPYHGVYLYLGQADGSFVQEMFFHFDGATSAVAADFDGDGDIDIAAIAYYANVSRGLDQSGFVYLDNEGGNFSAKYVEGLGSLGRFVAISAGDIDGDGDHDIALANLAYGPPGPLEITPELRAQWTSGTGFVLLRNVSAD